ncbi:MAG: hypothetical protein HGB11_13510 [Chlorobiales bacterium]|nr:hypothetical protein [Chlorobiales bacterium]
MKYRDTASFGKRQEYRAIAELLGRGYDVYQTLVDDQQIDCIVRLSSPNGPKYVDIQIKARSRFAQEKSWGDWPNIKLVDPRPNLVFIFYSEPLNATWVVPSLVVAREGYQAPSLKNGYEYKLTFAKSRKIKGEISFEFSDALEKYKNAYSIIDKIAGTKEIV